jgi:hypothetical protein
MKTSGRMEEQFDTFLFWALDRDERPVSCPGKFTPMGNNPNIQWV